jgi:hypothetical protein
LEPESLVAVFLIIKWRIRYNGILNARGWDGTIGNIGPETIHRLEGLGLKINQKEERRRVRATYMDIVI